MTTLETINSNEFQKELLSVKEQTSLAGISVEYPEIYFLGYFTEGGDKLKKVIAYDSLSKAQFYADRGNGSIFHNGEVI